MYTLRFPFRLPAGQAIRDERVTMAVGGKEYSLKKDGEHYVLTVDGLQSKDEAYEEISRVWTGLMCLLLDHELAPGAELAPQRVYYPKDPEAAAENLRAFGAIVAVPIDAYVDGALPAVYLSNTSVRVETAYSLTVTRTNPAETVLSKMATIANGTETIGSEKLQTALDLYGAYFTESSARTRFLTVIMPLESLATGARRPGIALDLLTRWNADVETALSSETLTDDEIASLESLRREICFRKDDSIRKQIYRLVRETFEAHGEPGAHELGRMALKLYDQRSLLVHEGSLPDTDLSRAAREAKELVQRVLRLHVSGRLREETYAAHPR